MNENDLYVLKSNVFFLESVEDSSLFYYFGNRVIITSKTLAKIAPRLFELLRLPRKKNDLYEHFKNTCSFEALSNVVDELFKNNFLKIADCAEPINLNASGWLSFISRFMSRDTEIENAYKSIENAKLSIIVGRYDATSFLEALNMTPIKTVEVLQRDSICSPPLQKYNITEVKDLESISGDLIVYLGSWQDQSKILNLNRELSSTKKLWFAVLADYFGGCITPIFNLPGGPCFHCFTERRLSHLIEIDKYDSMSSVFKQNENTELPLALFSSNLSTFANIEIIKIISKYFDTHLYRGCVEIDLLNLRTENHHILRNPLCPICSEAFHTPADHINSKGI